MKPPKAPATGFDADAARPRAAFLRCETLTKRADFVKASRAAYQARPGFVLQMRKRAQGETQAPETIRVGFTCSKKVGNAVARNRAKRRLREVARLHLPRLGKPGHDYVLVGRKNTTAATAFAQLEAEFAQAIAKLHTRAP